MTIPEQAAKRYRVKEPEFGDDLLSALRRPADTSALYDAAYDAAIEIERLRLLVGVQRPEDVARAGWKYIYAKRWRALIHVPERIADEVCDALRPHTGQPPQEVEVVEQAGDLAGRLTAAANRYGVGFDIPGLCWEAAKMIERLVLSAAPASPRAEGETALVQFARWAITEGPFEGCHLDGSDIQDKAEKLGLLIKTKYDPAVHGESDCDCEPGDDWFVLSPIIAEKRDEP